MSQVAVVAAAKAVNGHSGVAATNPQIVTEPGGFTYLDDDRLLVVFGQDDNEEEYDQCVLDGGVTSMTKVVTVDGGTVRASAFLSGPLDAASPPTQATLSHSSTANAEQTNVHVVQLRGLSTSATLGDVVETIRSTVVTAATSVAVDGTDTVTDDDSLHLAFLATNADAGAEGSVPGGYESSGYSAHFHTSSGLYYDDVTAGADPDVTLAWSTAQDAIGLSFTFRPAAAAGQTIIGTTIEPVVQIGPGVLVEFDPVQTIIGTTIEPVVQIGPGLLSATGGDPEPEPEPEPNQGTGTATFGVAPIGNHRVLFGPIGGQPIGQVNITSVDYVDALNSPGAASIVIPFAQPKTAAGVALVTREDLQPRRTAVWIMRDETLAWAGMLWGMSRDFVGGTRTLVAQGWQSYLRRRFYTTDQTFTGTDQLEIARQIIEHAQAVIGGNVGIGTADTTMSGVTRDRSYQATESKNYGDALEQLAAVQDGFDFRFEPSIDPVTGDLRVDFLTTYPAGGRATDFVLYHGVNCVLLSGDEDGSAATNSYRATGAGEGAALLSASAADTGLLAAEPLLEGVGSYVDVTVQATLQSHADRDLARLSASEVVLSAQMIPGALPALGSYEVGDLVRVVYDGTGDGFEVIDRTMRILSVRVSDSDGGESVTVELGSTDPVLAPDLAATQRENARRLRLLEIARRSTI